MDLVLVLGRVIGALNKVFFPTPGIKACMVSTRENCPNRVSNYRANADSIPHISETSHGKMEM